VLEDLKEQFSGYKKDETKNAIANNHIIPLHDMAGTVTLIEASVSLKPIETRAYESVIESGGDKDSQGPIEIEHEMIGDMEKESLVVSTVEMPVFAV